MFAIFQNLFLPIVTPLSPSLSLPISQWVQVAIGMANIQSKSRPIWFLPLLSLFLSLPLRTHYPTLSWLVLHSFLFSIYHSQSHPFLLKYPFLLPFLLIPSFFFSPLFFKPLEEIYSIPYFSTLFSNSHKNTYTFFTKWLSSR